MTKLNQIIAIEKGIKSRSVAEVSELYKTVQKPALFDGFNKGYTPLKDDDEQHPPQNQRVQFNGVEVLRQVANQLSELFDVTATKDFANCNAFADVTVDGEVLLSKSPATYLLFLEKQLTDLHTFVEKLPALDPAEEWKLDPNSNLYKTPPSKTVKTKKVQKPIVLYPATVEHPAQTQLITEDVTVGTWEQVKMSGALPEPRRKALLMRIEKLAKAVKFAREQANDTEVVEKKVGDKIFAWLLA
jgi:hypothetical protein